MVNQGKLQEISPWGWDGLPDVQCFVLVLTVIPPGQLIVLR